MISPWSHHDLLMWLLPRGPATAPAAVGVPRLPRDAPHLSSWKELQLKKDMDPGVSSWIKPSWCGFCWRVGDFTATWRFWANGCLVKHGWWWWFRMSCSEWCWWFMVHRHANNEFQKWSIIQLWVDEEHNYRNCYWRSMSTPVGYWTIRETRDSLNVNDG